MAITASSLVFGAMTYYWIAGALFYLTAGWALFDKADEPGWASLIPFYNAYVFLRIVGRPWWWLLLYCIPPVAAVLSIINTFDLARAYDRSVLFGFGLLFIGPIFVPILAFGEAEYVGDSPGGWSSVGAGGTQ